QWSIQKGIIIVVKFRFPKISVQIKTGAPTVAQFGVQMCIQFKTPISGTISIYENFIIHQGFLKLCVYLSSNTFITVGNASGTFCNLDALHPSSRNKTQSIRL